MNQEETESSENGTEELTTAIEQLQKAAAEKDCVINVLEQNLTEVMKQQKETDSRLAVAVNSYKKMITGNHADIPAELISGDSIEEIDSSLEKAKTLVARIRQGLEKDISAMHIPGGAPVRGEPDIAGLSPIEKIKYAMGRKQ
jgi:septal ring factor EnvC (AmiA/AmiB activator)